MNEAGIRMWKEALAKEAETNMKKDNPLFKEEESETEPVVNTSEQEAGEEEEIKDTEEEIAIKKEYLDLYNNNGHNHRAARRKMDKKYGIKKTTVIGSYKR